MSQTNLAKPGTILLLVGAILSAISALFMFGLMIGLQAIFDIMGEEAPAFSWMYGIFGVLLLLGSVFGFTAAARANEGDLQGAFVFGLVSALMPPLQILPLIGAIFCKVSED
jgi:hypothetical protein